MGNCRSCESNSVVEAGAAPATATATAKLVLQNGELREFEHPMRVSHVLQKEPGCFVCNADDMEFDCRVAAVSPEEELQPGLLYFLLPHSMLRRPLQADQMAALAVRASSALVKCRCCRGSVVFTDTDRPTVGLDELDLETVARHRMRMRMRAGSSGRARDFTSMLNVIQETPHDDE